MTYAQRHVPIGSVTSDEITYSPFVSADEDEFDASMMGAYEFTSPSAMSATAIEMRAMPQQRVMQVPGGYVPPGYKLVPLSGDGSTGMSTGKKVAIIVAIIVAIGVVVYYVKQRKGKSSKPALTPTQAVKKLPTSRLAQNLYARLAKNGKATRSTLAALDKIAQE